eukprot:15330532-Ditylum_brightwellii.AAC.1
MEYSNKIYVKKVIMDFTECKEKSYDTCWDLCMEGAKFVLFCSRGGGLWLFWVAKFAPHCSVT